MISNPGAWAGGWRALSAQDVREARQKERGLCLRSSAKEDRIAGLLAA